MESKPKWFGQKYKSPGRPMGSAPVTFIESNLNDLKGKPITNRVMKDDWGGSTAWMNDVVENVAKIPDMSKTDISSDQKNGFYAAGTTTIAKGQPSINSTKLGKKSTKSFD